MTFDIQRYQLRELLQTCIQHNQPYADHYQIRLELSAGDDALIDVDSLRFQQVLSNLLSNAAKFSPTGSTVTIATQLLHNAVRVSVIDQGPGIPEAFRGRIFEKFSQADSADARSKGGTGLGLAIVRELTDRMGGQIYFETQEGIGTQFHLEFPAQAVQPTRERSTLLIVEDEAQIARLLQGLLQRAGYDVLVASSLLQAKQLLEAQSVQLMTLELRLPDGHAGDWLVERRQQASFAQLPVLIVSLDEPQMHPLLAQVPHTAWLQKPIQPNELVHKLQLLQTR